MTQQTPTSQELAILGGSGHAREVAWIASLVPNIHVRGYIGPKKDLDVHRFSGPWLGEDDWLHSAALDIAYVIGIGASRIRQRLDATLRASERSSPVLTHPAATIGHGVEFGPGSIIWPGAVLTTDIKAGRHVHINTNVAVGHDVIIDEYSTLLPGCTVGGSARIGRAATVGAGASVLDGITIGAGAIVGAGALVRENVPADYVVVGVPARPIKPAK